MSLPCISRTFLGSPRSIVEARRFVTAMLSGWPEAEDAELIVSELATNAVRHSESGRFGGRFTVSIHTEADRLWLGVLDEGGPRSPRAFPPHTDGEDGRGLMLVTELATKWGVTGDDKGRIVWAVLDRLPQSAVRQ
ncbi:ATP-binding protein [Streptosporangium subroseum]|uniref:ATP-binding protein n=1 Tax=Streptosporangium subroseum TaxID=106412 RepID=UPI003091CC8A|nr:ATP-binding protein [Streptosporangium subroseum]